MAVPDGKPATSFNAMDREWVRAVANEEAGGAIPAPENPSNGDVLTYNSTSGAWEADAPSGGIPAPASPNNGDVLTYNSTSGEWEADAPSSGIPAPASPSDGDVLTYDSSTSAWVAEAPSGGGGVLFVNDTPGQDNTYVLDKNWTEIKTAINNGIFVVVFVDESSDPDIKLYINPVGGVIYDSESGLYSVEAGDTIYSASSPTGVLTYTPI